MENRHKHRCRKCDTIWEHADSCAGRDAAHKCPRCGEDEWFAYHGDRDAEYRDHHLKQDAAS